MKEFSGRSNIKIYNADCVNYLINFKDNEFDLAIVDPPYGINVTKLKIKANKKLKQWDLKSPTQKYFDELFRVSKNQIIWGMNFLNDYLPKCKKTIIWDKLNDGTFHSDYELAWTSIKGVKQHIYRIMWYGYFYPKEDMPLLHPTQKPIQLYKKILLNFAKKGDKIIDTHFGSGSLGIACWDLKYDLTAFEIDKDYYNDSVKRIENHTKQAQIDDNINTEEIIQKKIF